MKRREFISLLGSAAVTWPRTTHAQQQDQTKRIGVLIGSVGDAETQARVAAFRQTLSALGWTEGRNIQLIVRFGAADPDRDQAFVAELLSLGPTVIVTSNTGSV